MSVQRTDQDNVANAIKLHFTSITVGKDAQLI